MEFEGSRFVKMVRNVSSTLCVYKTKEGKVFGSFVDSVWKDHGPEEYPRSKSFVFTINENDMLSTFEHNDGYVVNGMLDSNKMFAMGRITEDEWNGPYFTPEGKAFARLSGNYQCEDD